MESIKELKKICQGPGTQKAKWLRIARIFSIYFTWFFLHFKITPNQLSILGTGLFISGTLCFLEGLYWLNLVGVSLLFLGIMMDLVDGEVARYRGMAGGLGGNFIEPLTHDIKYAFLFIPLVLGEYRSFIYPSLLIFLGFSATISKILFRLTKLRYIHVILPLRPKGATQPVKENKEKAIYQNNLLKEILGYFGGTTSIVFWLFLAVIFDKVYLIIIFYGILFPIVYLILLLKQYRVIKNIKK